MTKRFGSSTQKERRPSKVSKAMRCQLFKAVLVRGMTIKEASRLFNLNYSTAKSIIRDIQDDELAFINAYQEIYKNQESQSTESNRVQCAYREIVSKIACRNRRDLDYDFGGSIPVISSPIQLVCTVGMNFFDRQNLFTV